MADDIDKLRGDLARGKDAGGQVAQLREQISDIAKLSHSGKSEDAAQYRDRQAELRDLTARLIEAERGDLADAAIEKVGTEWKIRSGRNLLAWTFGDRATAEKFLDQLRQQKEQHQ